MENGTDKWEDGQAYESYVGRWSGPLARRFLAWLEPPMLARWLDVGCGTGQLTRAIHDVCAPASVTGFDPADGYVKYARERTKGQISFLVGDALAMPFRDAAFDIAASSLVLNFIPDPACGIREKVRVTRPGGMVAGYVWDYASGMQFMRYFWDAASALDHAARNLDEGRRFPLCSPEPLRELFADAGLACVRVEAIDIPTRFRDFDDLWAPFLGGQGPAPSYVARLEAAEREALRERLRSSLPTKEDGSIELTARAWAVRGSKAGR